MNAEYDSDFYTWTQCQAALLRQGRLDELDLENLAEEIESMGKRDRRALGSYVRNLLLHLLKWRYQPALQGPSWRQSISNAREEIEDIIADSPSLRATLGDLITQQYPRARRKAIEQTGVAPNTVPTDCPWTVAEMLDEEFWPD